MTASGKVHQVGSAWSEDLLVNALGCALDLVYPLEVRAKLLIGAMRMRSSAQNLGPRS